MQALILGWSVNCVIIYTNVENHVPVVTLSTQGNTKLLPHLKSGFKKTIIWNKYLEKAELLARNRNLNHLIEPSFQIDFLFEHLRMMIKE